MCDLWFLEITTLCDVAKWLPVPLVKPNQDAPGKPAIVQTGVHRMSIGKYNGSDNHHYLCDGKYPGGRHSGFGTDPAREIGKQSHGDGERDDRRAEIP